MAHSNQHKLQNLQDLWQGLFHKPLQIQKPRIAEAFANWRHQIVRIHVAELDELHLFIRSENAIVGDVLLYFEEEISLALDIRKVSIFLDCPEEVKQEKDFLCGLLPWASACLFSETLAIFSVLLHDMECSSEGENLHIHLPKTQHRIFNKENIELMEQFFLKRVGIEAVIYIKDEAEDLAIVENFLSQREIELNILEVEAKKNVHVSGEDTKDFRGINEQGEPEAKDKPRKLKSKDSKLDPKEFYKQKQSKDLIWGRMDNRLDLTPINKLDSESARVSVYGKVAKFEARLVSNNTKGLIKFAIHGTTGAISCVLFLRSPEEMDKLSSQLKNGTYVRADLDVFYDATYTKDLQGKVCGIVLADSPAKRQDLSLEKRVELHIHTNMSAKDGHSRPSELVKMADHFGMPAVALTDHGIVQAFPEAQDTLDKLRKNGSQLKLIFGSEGYLMDDGEGEFAYGVGDITIESSFVALDLETTGLNPENDRIIEIGAVRFTKDVSGLYFPEERYQTFVNPGIPVPTKVVEITGITSEMIQEGKDPLEALEELHAFIGEDALIGHNAFFDLSFLRNEAYRLRADEEAKLKFNPIVVDTLAMARSLLKDLGKYSLNAVAQNLQIPLDQHHRAVDDAICSGFIFVKLWEKEKFLPLRNLNEKLGQKDFAFVKNFKNKPYHIILLVKNLLGLYNLYRLISISHIRYFKGRPRIPRSVLKYFRDGLIIGSACEAGEVLRRISQIYSEVEGDFTRAKERIQDDKNLIRTAKFYDYLEIQPIGNNRFMIEKEGNYINSEEDLIHLNLLVIHLAELSKRDVVATCDSHFLDEEDAIYRRILQVSSGFDAQENPTNLYFRTTDEMLDEFYYLPEEQRYQIVVENTRKIADQVDPNIRPFPAGTFPPFIASASDDVEEMTWAACKRLYEKNGVIPTNIRERVEKELCSIIDNGFGIMYYISAKLVKKTNEDGYIVGSRGSVGSSVVAFLCGISEVNPLPAHYVCPACQYTEFAEEGAYGSGFDLADKACPDCGEALAKDGQDIPFETFLGFNGDKQPDIDLNFSGEYQAEAHQYIVEMFGESHTYRAGTITGYAEKNALGLVLKYAEEANIFLTRADSERLADGLIGIKRSTGQHPGGIVVIPKEREVYDFTPIQNPADKENASMHTTHFDFNAMHDTILKLDILGHDDPTMLKVMSDMTGVKIEDIPIPDKRVMELFQGTEALGLPAGSSPSDCGSLGLPEMGTLMARDMIKETKPTQFFDLVQLMGLSHGTDVWAGNAQDLIRSNTCTIEEVIGCRDGIMTSLINWGLPAKTSFDIMEKVRKGKGLTEEQEQLMRDNQVPDWYIDSCKKIKYMFPKAHAAAYVISSLRVAYFKVYYPEAYYAAYFSVRADEFDYSLMCQPLEKISSLRENFRKNFHQITDREQKIFYILELVEEMYLRGIQFAPIDIEIAGARRFKLMKDKRIMPALNTLTTISTTMANEIVRAREEGGPFPNHEELRRRAGLGQSAIESMANQGVLSHIPASSQLTLFDML